MPEVGLIPFARVAIDVAAAQVPAYRTRFSKHVFSQPQLLAILCLMRYEDWTFREAEVRLREHVELRAALGMERTPDHTTLYRFLRRLQEETIAGVLAETVRRMSAPPEGGTTVAVDGTGLAPGAVSTFFVKRVHDQGGQWHRWIKGLVAVDVPSRSVVAQVAKWGPTNDSATLRPLVTAAAPVVPIRQVLADAEFDSERNHRHIREVIGATSVIPAKRGKSTWQLRGIRAQMRDDFPRAEYAQRSLVESVFSAVKRKLSARAPGRSLETQRLQALLLGLAYNIYRLKPRLRHHALALIPAPPTNSSRMSTEPSDFKTVWVVA